MAEPTIRDIDALVGPATPHFAYQLRARVRELIQDLPPDHDVRRYGSSRWSALPARALVTKAEDSRPSRVAAGWETLPAPPRLGRAAAAPRSLGFFLLVTEVADRQGDRAPFPRSARHGGHRLPALRQASGHAGSCRRSAPSPFSCAATSRRRGARVGGRSRALDALSQLGQRRHSLARTEESTGIGPRLDARPALLSPRVGAADAPCRDHRPSSLGSQRVLEELLSRRHSKARSTPSVPRGRLAGRGIRVNAVSAGVVDTGRSSTSPTARRWPAGASPVSGSCRRRRRASDFLFSPDGDVPADSVVDGGDSLLA